MISQEQIREVLDVARRAGREIRAMQGKTVRETKGDGSPVSAADRLAAEIVLDGLARITPDIPVVCEESSADRNAAAHSKDLCWIVDPLDGTRSYLDGYGGYGVHVGLVAEGRPVAGAVYFPVEGKAYYTDGKSGAWRQGDTAAPEEVFAPEAVPDAGASIAISWGVRRAAMRSGRGLPYRSVTGVGGGRLCLVAGGGVQAALMETPLSYWDLAAAHAVLRAADGDLFALDDLSPLSYPAGRLQQPPSIAGRRDVVMALRDVAAGSLAVIGH